MFDWLLNSLPADIRLMLDRLKRKPEEPPATEEPTVKIKPILAELQRPIEVVDRQCEHELFDVAKQASMYAKEYDKVYLTYGHITIRVINHWSPVRAAGAWHEQRRALEDACGGR